MQYQDRTEEEKVHLAQEMCEYLNDLIKLDPDAVHNLCETRVPCNASLGNHHSVQVVGCSPSPLVGLLGILNGFIGTQPDGWGYIAGRYGDDGKLFGFDLASNYPRENASDV